MAQAVRNFARARQERKIKEAIAKQNNWPRRFMDKEGNDVVLPDDPRYHSAPFEEKIL